MARAKIWFIVAIFLVVLYALFPTDVSPPVVLSTDAPKAKLFCHEPRVLPTCAMPALMLHRPSVSVVQQRRSAGKVPNRLGYPYNITYFRPPYHGQPDVMFNGSMSYLSLFTDYDEAEWDAYCKVVEASTKGEGIDTFGNMVIPDRVVFLFVHDHATWEIGMTYEQLSPPLFKMDRVREGDGPGVSIAASEPPSVTNTDPNPVVMTFHLLFSTHQDKKKTAKNKDAAAKSKADIAKSIDDPVISLADIAATVTCIKEHMLLWYPDHIVDKLMSEAMGTMMLSDRTPFRVAQRLLNGYETVRLGDWQLVPTNDGGKLRSYDTTVTSQIHPTRSFVEYNTEAPQTFILPRLKTILSLSDERGKFVEMARMIRQWRLNRPGERSQLRQYGLLRINLTDVERSGIERFMLTLRFFRPGLITPSRALGPIDYVVPSMGPAGELPQFVCDRKLAGDATCAQSSLLREYPIHKRPYLWAFAGLMKNDRPFMIATLRNFSNITQTTNQCCRGNPERTYKNAIFVPIGRGQITLDCVRIYEALTCGAIPVIVASMDEVANTYLDFGPANGPMGAHIELTSSGILDKQRGGIDPSRLPPFVFADSWPSAAEAIGRLSHDPQQLQRYHYKCSLWQMRMYWHLQERTVYGREGGSIQTDRISL